MKKSVLMFFLIAVIAFAGQAQTKPTGNKPDAGKQKNITKVETPEQKAQAAVDKLDKQVTLTADQKTSVKALALTKFNSIEATQTKYKGMADKKDVMNKEMQTAKTDYNAGLKKILTPEQIKKKEDAEKHVTPTGTGTQTKPTSTETKKDPTKSKK
jgi:hypothetical protein